MLDLTRNASGRKPTRAPRDFKEIE